MSNTTPPANALAWAQVDVFADAAYQGNMLAIFPDATGLTDAEMQALARETNLSETTFVFPRDPAAEGEEGIRVRIFTTVEELPFAGHPTLGTASWLRLNRPELAGATELTLQLNVGRVAVRFPQNDAAAPCPGGLMAEMLQPNPRFLGGVERDRIAAALRLTPTQMHAALVPEVVSTGLPFLIAPLASLEALQAVQPDFTALEAVLDGTAAKFLYCIAQEDGATWHARMPLYGGEDPATGSAAGCAISYLVRHGAVTPGSPVTIFQGQQVRRPSRIGALADLTDGQVTQVRVRGCTMPVASGRFLRP